MKNIFKHFASFLLCFILFQGSVNAVWDLGISSIGAPADITMEAVSVSFEGRNKPDPDVRTFQIFYGNIYRNIYQGTVKDSQIVFFQWLNTQTTPYLASCFYESNQYTYRRWGFAKYLITFKNLSDTNKSIRFYFNSLDSKCGTDTIPGYGYHADIFIEYYGNANPPYVKFYGSAGFERYVYRSLPVQEVTMWDLFYNRSTPLGKDFKVRSTPFPFNPKIAENIMREVVVGTKIVLDTVYDNLGTYDKFGYNTWIGPEYRNYFTNPPVPSGQNDQGNTYSTPAMFSAPLQSWGMKLTAESGDSIIIKSRKKLWVSGYGEQVGFGDTVFLKSGSTLIKEENAQINTCRGGVLIDEGANTFWANNSSHHAWGLSLTDNSEIYYKGTQHTINNGGHVEIDGFATLKLGDNTTLIFDGASNPNTYLKLKPNSQVVLGNNAQIKFINGAYLDADGATFNNPNGYWLGILFENAGANTNIRNCTFNKATTALKFYYSSSSGLSFPVTNNIFNVTSGKGVEAENLNNVTFDQNIFNLSSGTWGVYFHTSSSPQGSGLDPLVVRFTANIFTGGDFPLFISGLASNIIPVYVYANTFSGGQNCFIGRFITGDIKNNNITRSSGDYAFRLIQSNPNMLYNNIKCQNGRAVYFQNSSPVLTSVRDENRVLLIGGINNIEAVNGDAVNLDLSNPLIDFGSNWFTISNANYYHIYGGIPGAETIYYARINCWYGTGHHNYIYNINSLPVSVITEFNSNCPNDMVHISPIVNDIGSGVYDTVWVVEDYIGTPAPDDEMLYTQASLQQNDGSYFDAITDYKNLINNYGESNYLNTSLYSLYACYEGLDTSDQSHRDLIFSDLKNYLIDKIEQYNQNDEFINIAYNLILMCETKLENYNEAMTGYEFIALYHPDPDQRIWASLDYEAIQDLINGMGGGMSNKPNESKSILKLMDKKPYTKIVKNVYLKGTRELEKKLKDRNLSRDASIVRSKLLIDRASQNINISRSLSKKQREERQLEDIKLLFPQNPVIENDNTNNIPLNYALHQNYPNPFNPATTIKYELPNDGMISFKVYDILGKEVYSINEFRKAGIHELKFDGSNFASGVYFYQIEAGTFIESKKMVLVK